MTPREALIAARAKIEKPENWTQDFLARSAKGRKVSPRSANAVCWCAMGALEAVCRYGSEASIGSFDALAHAMPSLYGIAEFNDTHTHSEVLAKFDEAIEALS